MHHFAALSLLVTLSLVPSIASAGDDQVGGVADGSPTTVAPPMFIAGETPTAPAMRDTAPVDATVPRVDRRPRVGLIVGGAVLFASAHIPTMLGAVASGSPGAWLLAIPVFGPLVAGTMAVVGGGLSSGSCSAGPCGGGLSGMFVVAGIIGILDGLAQGAGLAMMVAGSVPRVVRPTPQQPQFNVAFVGPNGAPGLTFGVTHF